MIEKLVPIKLPPGFYSNGTLYDAKGRWYDGNLVRFHEGSLRPIGGWRSAEAGGSPVGSGAGSGTNAKRVLAWPSTSGTRVVVATGTGVYAYNPDVVTAALTNISPAGFASAAEWHLDTFGGSLVACDGVKVYEWDGNLANDLVEVTGDPTNVLGGVVVTPERFLVALGAGSNTRKVQWPDQETTNTWTPTATNAAGDFELATVGEIVCGRRGKGQTLVFTSTDLWSMTYIGGDLIYSFRQEGDNCGIVSAGAAVVVDGRAFWMGRQGFFMYDGYVRSIPCDVSDRVFGAYSGPGAANQPQCFTVSAFSEVWWLYPTGVNGDMKYVVYNYRDGYWYTGDFDEGGLFTDRRLTGCDAGVVPYPLTVNEDNLVIEQEVGTSTNGQEPYAQSGPIDIGDGDRMMRVQKIVSDIDGATGMTYRINAYAGINGLVSPTSTGPFQGETDLRITARMADFRFIWDTDESAPLGIFKLGVIPQGRR